MNFVIYDIETNDKIIDNVNRIHVISAHYKGRTSSTNDYEKMRQFFNMKDVYFVGHNIQQYDIPCIEKVLGIKIDTSRHIDTLALSWYLTPKRSSHNLKDWGVELGFNKVEVEDWEGLSYDEYRKRCEGDVEINKRLFEKQLAWLREIYDNEQILESFMRFISFKMFQLRVLSENPFDLDIDKCNENLDYLMSLKETKARELSSVMPRVNITSKKKKPKQLLKKDGSMTSGAISFLEECQKQGLDFETTEELKVIKGFDVPNPDSPSQVKDWLFSIGWQPATFTTNDKGKEVPQIYTKDKTLCESVLALGDVVLPLDEYGVLKHRIGILKGFLKNHKDGKINQYAHGFSSTLRFNYGGIVNLPKVGIGYGEYIRSVLTFRDSELFGSDLAALEDRTKQHYIMPYDPEYVKSMQVDGYDPHLALAQYSKVLTPEQVQAHKDKKADYGKIRHSYKQVNYMSTYGIGATKLSKYLSVKLLEAEKMLDDYWGLNWSVKAVSKDFKVKQTSLGTWIQNPINQFWYELRSEKDRFSAVNQSTGAFIFDLWFKYSYEMGLKNISLCMHDELCGKASNNTQTILTNAIEKVNNVLGLRVKMGIDVKFGKNYADVH